MSSPPHTRHSPFLSTILSRYPLTKEGSTKRVDHVELCLKDSGIVYKPGDSIGIFPLNPVSEVQSILETLHTTGEEPVLLRDGESMPFAVFLLRRANLQTCSQALFALCLHNHPHSTLQQHLPLLEEPRKTELKALLALYHVSDFLAHFGLTKLTPQELTAHLSPMLPRFYSIASSMQTVGQAAHLAVALTTFDIQGRQRYGVASHYLCCTAPVQEKTIPIYLQTTKEFTLPVEKSRAMIMIGAGTGVAPYRGFLQERLMQQATGNHWLICGQRHRHADFLYESYWAPLAARNQLKLSLAFSRDQEEKRYVQHLLLEEGEELYRWIEEGACLYVCGDAEKMAKEVHQALLQVFMRYGACTETESVAKMQRLRKEKRYLRDIY